MKLKYILPAFALAGALATQAQTMNSAYFLEGVSTRHQLNPSFGGERNYVGMPVISNFNLGLNGNIGLKDFVYKYNDPTGKYKYTTFMSPTVDAKKFLNNLPNNARLGLGMNLPVISVGFKGMGGYNTIGINTRLNLKGRVPKELFKFMKSGQTGDATNYNIKDLALNANAYAELALGHSRDINDQWRVGGKFKILLGGIYANMRVDEMNVRLAEDQWLISSKGSLGVSGTEFVNGTDDFGNETDEIDDVETSFNGLGGFGLAIDLGATYKLDDQWTFSAALLDLGFLSWKNVGKGSLKGDYEFDGFNDFVLDDDEGNGNSLSDQFDQMQDDIEEAFKFVNDGKGSVLQGLAATLNLAAEYRMPFYDKFTAGLLWSTHFNRPYTWTEARLSANVSPLKWLNGGINYGISTFGSTFGWVINFHPKGFNLFVGGDSVIPKLSKQGIPLYHANANINLGINFTF